MCSSVKTYGAGRVLQKAQRNHCRFSNSMAHAAPPSFTFVSFVTKMASQFLSSKWQKWERYGCASIGWGPFRTLTAPVEEMGISHVEQAILRPVQGSHESEPVPTSALA